MKKFNPETTPYVLSILKFPLLTPTSEYDLSVRLYDGRLTIIQAMMSNQSKHAKLLSIVSDLDPDSSDIVQGFVENLTEQNYNLLHAFLMNADFSVLVKYSEGSKAFETVISDMRKCRDLLINSNLRLVVSIAKFYSHSGVDFADIVQEGNIGLITAVDRFNPYRNNRLATAAVHWIKSNIIRYLSNNSRMIRLPAHVIGALQKAYRKLNKEMNRVPSPEEMSKEVKLTFTVSEIQELMSLFIGSESYDNMMDGESQATYRELFESTDPLIDARLEEMASKDLILKDLERCTSREEKAFRLRIGF